MKLFDPWLEKDDDNPLLIKKIDEKIFKFHLPKDECLRCRLDMSSFIPTCHKDCSLKLKIDPKDSKRSFVILRTHNTPYKLRLSRAELVWNYYNKYNFIFRANELNDIILHHLNRDSLDDTFENIRLLMKIEHDRLHKYFKELQSGLQNLRYNKVLYRQKKNEVKEFLLSIHNSQEGLRAVENIINRIDKVL